MSLKTKVINILDNYCYPDLRNIIVDFAGITEYKIQKYIAFNEMWPIIKRHREVIDDPERRIECVKLEMKFDAIFQKWMIGEMDKYNPSRKQFKRDCSYLIKLASKERMYENMSHNFQVPLNNIIRCGICGNKNHIDNMYNCNKPKYKYKCKGCINTRHLFHLYIKKHSSTMLNIYLYILNK